MEPRRNPSLKRARAGQGENVPCDNPGFSLDTLMEIAQTVAKDMGVGKTLSVGVQSESFAVMIMAHGLEPTLGGIGPLEGWHLRMVLRLLVVSSVPDDSSVRHFSSRATNATSTEYVSCLVAPACTLQVPDAGARGAGAVGT
ncbi:hypothetical protein CSAL01_06102 [Colletotrichum salicis]|uniref:Uncharacterized protein n=1 Tax=Colletotrichum salicis TaxID=1209931 RepID=A0A135VA08_9PEZI|nr:hypothetical protein CSAL01_06102 [Colletotrichum salicis]